MSYQSLNAYARIIDVNQAWLKLFGYEQTEVKGKWFGEFLDEKSKGSFPEYFKICREQGIAEKVELRMVKKSGEFVDVLIDGVFHLDVDGTLTRTHAVITDVTRQKEMLKIINRPDLQ